MRSNRQQSVGNSTYPVADRQSFPVMSRRVRNTATSAAGRRGARKSDQNDSGQKNRQRRHRGLVRPSAVIDKRRTNNPFATSQSRSVSVFAQAYADRAIPCRIDHGGVKHKLQWDVPPGELNYGHMLPIFAHGLAETRHPYVFVAYNGFIEMISADGAQDKVIECLSDIVRPLRAALSTRDTEVLRNGLNAVRTLSNLVGSSLDQFLEQLLIPIKRRLFDGKWRELVFEILQCLEMNGGADAGMIIKRKVPTYQPCDMF